MLAAIIQGLGSGAIIALIAVGLVLVFKGSKVLNLAQGEIGALSLFVVLALLGHPASGWTGPVILVASVALAAGLGIAMERLIMRPLVDRPPVQGTIATLGVAIVLIYGELLAGGMLLPATQNNFPMPVPRTAGVFELGLLGARITSEQLLGMVLTVAVGLGLAAFFRRSRFGLAVVAATSDNTVAKILGIPVRQVARFTWGVGGALAGMAAALIGPFLTSVAPGTMTFQTIGALAGAVVGGLDSVEGAIAGSLLVGLTAALAQHATGNAAFGQIAVLVLVVGTLMLRPRGLLGGAGVEL
jgi:branched-chain amino acid transport system permease protein